MGMYGVGYNGANGKRIYLPVRTWDKTTDTVGKLWGSIS